MSSIKFSQLQSLTSPPGDTVFPVVSSGSNYKVTLGSIKTAVIPSWSEVTGKPNFNSVAFSGLYADLSGKPTIPVIPTLVSAFTNDRGYLTTVDYGIITNAPQLSAVATSGNWNDVVNKPAWFNTTTPGYLYSDGSGTLTFQNVIDTSGGVSTATVKALIANSLSNFVSGVSTATVTALIANSLTNFVNGVTTATVTSLIANSLSNFVSGVSTATVTALIANSLTNNLATVARTGNWNDVVNKPSWVSTTATGYLYSDGNGTLSYQYVIDTSGGVSTATVTALIANSLSNFVSGVTTATVTSLIANSLTNFVTTATVTGLIANSLTNYATQSYVTSQGYLTTASVATLIANSLTNNLATVARTGNWTDVVNKPAWFSTTATGYLYSDGTGTLGFQSVQGGGGFATTSTLVNGTYTVALATTGQLNLPGAANTESDNARIQSAKNIDILSNLSLWTFGTDGTLTLPNSGELRPSTAAYDSALAGWEFIRGGYITATINNGLVPPGGWPMVDWYPTGTTAQGYIDFLATAYTLQSTPGATLIILPLMTVQFYNDMRASLIAIRDSYDANTKSVSLSSAYGQSWNFGATGSLTLPASAPITFTANLVPVYHAGGGGNAWHYTVIFQPLANGDGYETMISGGDTVWDHNTGYQSGDSWNFTQADHGIPGYTFTLTLGVVNDLGGGQWSANFATGPGPEYPSTVKSTATIKLSADTKNWTFGTDGNLTLPTNSGQSAIHSSGFITVGPTTPLEVMRVALDGHGVTIGGNSADNGLTYQRYSLGGTPIDSISTHRAGNLAEMRITADGESGGAIKLTSIGVDGYIALVSNSNEWHLGNTGNLTVPGDILGQEGNDLAVQVFNPDAQGGVSFVVQNRQVDLDNDRTTQFEVTPQDIKLTTDFSGNKNEWTFGTDGTTKLPDQSIIRTQTWGAFSLQSDNADIVIMTDVDNSQGWTFGVGGNLSAPTNGTVTASKFASYTNSWTLATGANTKNFSVPGPGTYTLWVNGTCDNGIVTYTATVVVTNVNVPVLGSQYGWYYDTGNMLVLDTMPAQITGTAGQITTGGTTVGNASRTFTFGITNNSVGPVIVNYGYTRLG